MSCSETGCGCSGEPAADQEEAALSEELCRCPGGMSEKFIEPCILLLLREKDSYGYSLLEEMERLGVSTDASVIYKNLRRLEKVGVVVSNWDTRGPGPARRYYKIMPEGEDLLDSWVATIQKNQRILSHFISVYNKEKKGGN